MTKKLFIILAVMFIASCTFSTTSDVVEDEQSTGAAESVTDVNFEEEVNQLKEQFSKYDQNYNPILLLNAAFISDTTLGAMDTEYASLSNSLTTLREKGMDSSYNATTYEQCISAISKYNKYIELIAEEDVLFDVKGTQENLVDYYFWAAEYDKAKAAISRVKQTITAIKEIQKAENALGIAVIPQDSIVSWDDYYNAYVLYEQYISSYENQGYTDTTVEKEEAYFKELAEAIAPDEDSTSKEVHDQVAEWYNQNIGSCIEE